MPVPSSPFPRLAPPLQLLLASLFLLLCALTLGACTRPNPDFCCSSESECASLGVDELRSCSSGRVCDANVCRDVQCESADQCTSEAPYCANQVCKATCAGDGDCVGAPGGPLCADDGVCVGCKSNDDCGEEAPICSPTKRVCSPCRADADCSSGVCLAADGVCAKESEITYVSQEGMDATCGIKTSPCRTFTEALARVTALRPVIRLLGRSFEAPDGITIQSKNVYIDAENTTISRLGTGPMVAFQGNSSTTLEGVKINVGSANTIVAETTSTVRLSQLEANGRGNLDGGYAVFASTGTVRITDSKFFGAWILCNQATLHLTASEFRNVELDGGSNCNAHLHRNRIQDARVSFDGGMIFQNNLLVSTSPTCSANIGSSGADRIDFNTFVCRHSPPVDEQFQGTAINCSSVARPKGNLFAWDSIRPAPGCALEYSLLPVFAEPIPGQGNSLVDMESVFVNYSIGDYHLSSNSPAKGSGDPKSTLSIDIEGNPRPNPAGSAPDIGAFEAP